MPAGRPALHANPGEARRIANRRSAERAKAQGLIQRSVRLPEECWQRLRAARSRGETSDAETFARLLLSLEVAASTSSAD